MRHDALSEFVAATAEEVRMPGVAVGVWANGQEAYACHGVTSLQNPVPVNRDTAFLLRVGDQDLHRHRTDVPSGRRSGGADRAGPELPA
jgi:hypothetical protein